MAKCLECVHWKPCFNDKEWDARIGDPCEHFATNVQPVRHGHWMGITTSYGEKAICAICGFDVFVNEPGNGIRNVEELKYCPNCGAKMDEENDDEA